MVGAEVGYLDLALDAKPGEPLIGVFAEADYVRLMPPFLTLQGFVVADEK